ncbi:MAG: response regulator [Phycisphaerales bacterium]|nr:response regulator [Phycisphaerales bacterium]
MSEKTRILMIDDEPNVLSGYRRSIGRNYDLVTAGNGLEGLKAMREQGPFAVVVTDMRMPEMDGLEFLKQAQVEFPESVYVMLTGNADQQTAIEAINQGQIFRFLNKPCDSEIMDHTIRACKKQYDLIRAEKELLNKTLNGSVKLLIEAMVFSDPIAADVIRGVRERALELGKAIGFDSEWRFTLAYSLFYVGLISNPRTSDDVLYSDEYISTCAASGGKLLRHIPKLGEVAQIVSNQRTAADLPVDFQNHENADLLIIGSEILRLSFDWYCAGLRFNGKPTETMQYLRSTHSQYDERLLEGIERIQDKFTTTGDQSSQVLAQLSVRDLREGMLIDSDIKTKDNTLLVSRGQELSLVIINRLRGFDKAGLIGEMVSVWLDHDDPILPRKSA